MATPCPRLLALIEQIDNLAANEIAANAPVSTDSTQRAASRVANIAYWESITNYNQGFFTIS